MKVTRRQLAITIGPPLVFFFLASLAGAAGYRFNSTPSMPVGIWKITDKVAPGMYVSACIPPTAPMMDVAIARHYLPDGACEGGYAPVLKRIAATGGDTVTLTEDAVTINGAPIPNTKTLAYRNIDPLPAIARGTYRVSHDEYWLISNDHPRSFDSRYFGGIQRQYILHGMKPVLVF